jgi:F-type H+-transporting ATPase subunit delta
MDAAPDVHRFLFHPEIPLDRKRMVIRAVAPEGLTSQAAGMLDLLVRDRSVRLLPEILGAFGLLRQESYGVLKAEVETVRPMPEDLKQGLRKTLQRLTGHEVDIQERLNPAVLGGARIRVGDRIVDGSVAGRLEHLKQQLLRSGMPERAVH